MTTEGTCQKCGATGEGWDPIVRAHRLGGERLRSLSEPRCPGSLRKSVEEAARPKPTGARVPLRRL